MTASKLEKLQASKKHAKMALFILSLVAAGVTLDRVHATNLETKGVQKSLVVIPLDKDSKPDEWVRTTFFTEASRNRLVHLAAKPQTAA
jgi:hypothetical protein